jgi:hypothetical protein
MIPKRIFYCWITKDEIDSRLPDQYEVALDQWKSVCRPEDGWEYILVNRRYMKDNYDEKINNQIERLLSFVHPAGVADYCRFVVTMTKGGFYMDLDTIISPKFLDLVNSETPIISARPYLDLQFMCHPGGENPPISTKEGIKRYRNFTKLIVGNYVIKTSSNNINYLHIKSRNILSKLHEDHEVVFMHNCTYLKTNMWEVKYFYFDQPMFHFDFNSHNGDKLGFEDEFNEWKDRFLDYYNKHHS